MSAPATLPDAVVFDCDGTLVDSERVAVDAMRGALAALGHELTGTDVGALVGHTWPDNARYFVDRWGMRDEDLAAYLDEFRAIVGTSFGDDRLLFDDVTAVVAALAGAEVPMGVCTSSGRAHLERVLDHPPLRGRFAVTVALEDTDRHKPDPAPYREALTRLGRVVGRRLEPARVAVVEDSRAGVASASAAGCWVVAVDRGHGFHDLAGADLVVERLSVEVLAPAGPR